MWRRVDSRDQAIWSFGSAPEDLRDWAYRAAQAIAIDNLRLGPNVLADCVNPWPGARAGWEGAAARTGAEPALIEVACGDVGEHRRRVETRVSGIPGFKRPDWAAALSRRYEPVTGEAVRIDTSRSIEEAGVLEILAVFGEGLGTRGHGR